MITSQKPREEMNSVGICSATACWSEKKMNVDEMLYLFIDKALI